uniref:LRRCT domain-containing protein n=3 Tax=Octopus bimaculoides TaxID=37653 RepID=A0A0L8GXS8_OCTBM|eukprot:XP_014777416.1 PREDICTED: chaoptin-like isoform X1 [Octopus bimaculoides]
MVSSMMFSARPLVAVILWTLQYGSSAYALGTCPGQCRCNRVEVQKVSGNNNFIYRTLSNNAHAIQNYFQHHQQQLYNQLQNGTLRRLRPYNGHGTNADNWNRLHWTEARKYWHRTHSLRQMTQYKNDMKIYNETRSRVHMQENGRYRYGTDLMCVGIRDLPTSLPTDVVRLSVYGEIRHPVFDSELAREQSYSSLQLPSKPKEVSAGYLTQIDASSFRRAPRLQDLALVGNRIRFLSPHLFQNITELINLNLRKNNIQYLSSAALQGLPNLQEIRLSNNKIAYINERFFQWTRKIVEIYLDTNRISRIYSGLFNSLRFLEVVDLSRNNLNDMPRNVFYQNSKLKVIRLDKNRLKLLRPEWFRNLQSLEVLSLKGNRFWVLPNDMISRPNALRELYLSHNFLSNLNKTFFDNLEHLETIDLYSNKITKLPFRCFDRQYKLKNLNLADNFISNLDTMPFYRVSTLEELNLSLNWLENISKGLFSSTISLLRINLSFNKLSAIYNDSFLGLTHMRELNLANNSIRHLDARAFSVGKLNQLSQLTWLNLQFNQIGEILPQVFHEAPHLKFLNIGHNRIRALHNETFQRMPYLSTLLLNNNDLERLTVGQFHIQKSLSHLNLAKNRLRSLEEGIFSGLGNLQKAVFTFNQISSIDEKTFEDTPNLFRFEFANNKLSTFNFDILAPMRRLHYVDLNRNLLTSLKETKRRDIFIVYLSLAANELVTLEKSILRVLVPGASVVLSDNPLDCDCKLRWLREYVQTKQLILSFSEQTLCKMPRNVTGLKMMSLNPQDFKCVPILYSSADQNSMIVINNVNRVDSRSNDASIKGNVNNGQKAMQRTDNVAKQLRNAVDLQKDTRSNNFSYTERSGAAFSLSEDLLVKSNKSSSTTTKESSRSLQCTVPLANVKFNRKGFRKFKAELFHFHATVIDSFGQIVCNGHSLSPTWILTTLSCIRSLMTTSSDNTGSFPINTQVRIGHGHPREINKVIVQPHNGSLALLRVHSNSSFQDEHRIGDVCLMNKTDFSIVTKTLKTGAFTANVDGRKSGSKLKAIRAKYSPAFCSRQRNKICVRMQNRTRQKRGLFTLGSPLYFGSSSNWRLVGIGSGFKSTSNTEISPTPSLNIVDFYPLWNILEWLNRTIST